MSFLHTIDNNVLNNLETLLNLKAVNTHNIISIESTNIPRKYLTMFDPILNEDNLTFIYKVGEMTLEERNVIIDNSLKLFRTILSCLHMEEINYNLPAKEDYGNQLLPTPLLRSQITLYLYNKINFIIKNIDLCDTSILYKLGIGEFTPEINFMYFMDSLDVSSDRVTVGLFNDEINIIKDLNEEEFNEYLRESEYSQYIINAMFMYVSLKTNANTRELQLLNNTLVTNNRVIPNTDKTKEYFIDLSIKEYGSLEVKYLPRLVFINLEESLKTLNSDSFTYLCNLPIPKRVFKDKCPTIENLCDILIDNIKSENNIKTFSLDFPLNKVIIIDAQDNRSEVENIKDTVLYYIDDSLRNLLNIEWFSQDKLNEYLSNKDKLIEGIFVEIINRYL